MASLRIVACTALLAACGSDGGVGADGGLDFGDEVRWVGERRIAGRRCAARRGRCRLRRADPDQAHRRHRQREPHLRQLLRLVPRRRRHRRPRQPRRTISPSRTRPTARRAISATRTTCALTDWNDGEMDGWDAVTGATQNGDNLALRAVPRGRHPELLGSTRRHFTLGDHFFANVLGPSFPGHMFVLAAQAGWADGNPTTQVTAPVLGLRSGRARRWSTLEDRTPCTTKQVFPCFNIPIVPDVLPAGVDWKFYGSNFYVARPRSGRCSTRIDGDPQRPAAGRTSSTPTQFDTDVAERHAPHRHRGSSIRISTTSTRTSAASAPARTGPSGYINQLMQSELLEGHRHPLHDGRLRRLVRSRRAAAPVRLRSDARPTASASACRSSSSRRTRSPASSSTSSREQASIPRFIEKVFGATPTLSTLDPAAQDGQANDLMDAFDFTQTPLPPLVLAAADVSLTGR